MGTVFDKDKAFEGFFYQQEGFHLLAERCYDEIMYLRGTKREQMIKAWMQYAFEAGAKAMADDTLNTLLDYGTAVAGLEYKFILNSREKYTIFSRVYESQKRLL